ncbi:hypothetical protein QQF64_018544 [Cirrhinus molitorella]|uniref:HEAT repeat-containing protein 1 n=1 Tax=Cirrhinus molitorella TaxID=172907 RepID=A0ABR3LD48_9TELE
MLHPSGSELQMASCYLKPLLLSQHPLTHGWAKVLKNVLAKTAPSDVLSVVNQMLTTTLTKNLANMDPATKRNTLQNVCDILSRQGSSVRERAAFVVFSNVLLQSLQSMTESQHLHTAQSVYKLLEPLLLQVYTIQPEQVSSEEINECLPVFEILGEFLQKMRSGLNAEREQGLLLLSLLRLFITALKCPDSSFKVCLFLPCIQTSLAVDLLPCSSTLTQVSSLWFCKPFLAATKTYIKLRIPCVPAWPFL